MRLSRYAIPVVIGVALAAALLFLRDAAAVVGGVSTIILTSILVSVTWYYADETRTMREEAQASRRFNMPVLRLTGTLTHEPNVALRNIGRGFARDADISITEFDGDKEPVTTSLQIPVLGPGEGIEFRPRSLCVMAMGGFVIKDERIEFRAEGTYYDAVGSRQELHDSFSLSEFITKCEALGVVFESVSHESEWHKKIGEDRFRKDLLSKLASIADSISRFRLR